MTSLLAFIFVLGVLIFVHELGHFLMARRIGVRVLTFSLGFGPKILKVRRGDTEYCVSAIPLGGYVKMAGENTHDGPTGATDEFLSKTKWQRFQVLVMGPVMNLALAVVVLALVLHHGIQVPAFDSEPVVVGSFAEGAVAKAAGIQPGDRIIAVNGVEVPTWERFFDGGSPAGESPGRAGDRSERAQRARDARAGSRRQVRAGRHRRAAPDASADSGSGRWRAGRPVRPAAARCHHRGRRRA